MDVGISARRPVAQFAATCGTDAPTYTRDRPGMSAFVLEDGVVYHTYSTYARGLDGLWGMYQWLDRAPKGRNETGVWWRRHDEIPRDANPSCSYRWLDRSLADWKQLAWSTALYLIEMLSASLFRSG